MGARVEVAEFLVRGVELTEAEVARVARALRSQGVRAEPLPGGGLRAPGLRVEGGRLAEWGPLAGVAVLVKVAGVLRSMGFRAVLLDGLLAARGHGLAVLAEVEGRVLRVSVRRLGLGARPGFLDELAREAGRRGLELRRVNLEKMLPRRVL